MDKSNTKPRTIFFISDGTGITAEALGQSLLTQFNGSQFKTQKIPYINTIQRANETASKIINIYTNFKNHADLKDAEKLRPIVISSLVDPDIRDVFKNKPEFFFIDLFEQYLEPLEKELGVKASNAVGKAHGLINQQQYDSRIDAINYTLQTDDGLSPKYYESADIIIIGVSRCGKTPTCLYLSVQFGINAANYPLTEEDLENTDLPKHLEKYKYKLFGLSIDVDRLHQIRTKRRANSKYSSYEQCEYEVKQAEKMMTKHDIPFMYSTFHSIEEISTSIITHINNYCDIR